jgi:exopolysaccharide production protein ExoQ
MHSVSPIQLAMPATVTSAPVWHFALSWVIVLPLFFFSANGTLIPPTEDPSFAATGADPSSHGSAFHMITVAGILLICSVLVSSRWQSLVPFFWRTKVLLALPLLAIFSSVWSEQPAQTLISGTILLVFTVFALYVGDRFSFQEQIELVMLVGSVALPLSIALALFVPSMGASAAGWRGIFGHKQNCAAVSTLWLVTAVHWKGSGIYQKMFRVASIVMSGVLIIMSASRTGWALALAAFAISAVIWMMQKMPALESILVLLVVLALAAGAGYAVINNSTDIVTAAGKDPTLSQRTIIWNAVWGEITKHPILGYGFNAFWKGLYGASQAVVLTSGWNVFQAQDGFLDVWLSVGLVGVVLVAVMVAQSMKNAVRSFRTNDQTYVRWCIVVILCTLLYNIGESTIGVLSMSWFLFLLAAIGLQKAADNRDVFHYALPQMSPQMDMNLSADRNAE